MTRSPVSLPVERWPELDRQRWLAAQAPAGFLELPNKPASHWSPHHRVITEAAYGRFLAFLEHDGALDPSCTPGERATEPRLRAFVTELQAQVAPASASMIVGALLRMLVLEPERDWTFLSQAHRHLKRTAVPSRDKLSRMVPAAELLELGIWLMETWADDQPQRVHKATRYRDGLIIALLISCPIRLKNLASLVIGQHLLFDGEGYRLRLTAAETKTRRPYVAMLPHELTRYIDQWLEVHRPTMTLMASPRASAGAGRRLWIDRWGQPMSGRSIQRQIWVRTRQAFGKGICPHLFRDIAVTELVDSAPDDIGIAPDLLGHADLRTTQKHYIKANGMRAHVRVQEVIAARRRAAAARRDVGA